MMVSWRPVLYRATGRGGRGGFREAPRARAMEPDEPGDRGQAEGAVHGEGGGHSPRVRSAPTKNAPMGKTPLDSTV